MKLRELENFYIKQIVEVFHGNKIRSAEYLGINKKTLYNRLKEIEIKLDEEGIERAKDIIARAEAEYNIFPTNKERLMYLDKQRRVYRYD